MAKDAIPEVAVRKAAATKIVSVLDMSSLSQMRPHAEVGERLER